MSLEPLPHWDIGPASCESDRKSTRLNSSHPSISYAVFCLKKKITPEGSRRVQLGVPGLYNVYNALGAASLARTLGASLDQIHNGLAPFRAAFGRFVLVDFD